MALFNNEAEQERKAGLRYLEDRRIALAERCAKEGFKPERMLFCSDQVGSFAALARDGKRYVVIASPVFGDAEGDFRMETLDELHYEKEEVLIKGQGLNGMFGFGTKPARGFILSVEMSESIAKFEFVAGRTTYLVVNKYGQNPLLKLKRRRGDANVVWDFMPIDTPHIEKIEKELDTYYLA